MTIKNTTTFGTSNGRESHAPAVEIRGLERERDWRERTVDRMLRCAARDGTPAHVALEAMRVHLPGADVRTFNDSRDKVLAALPGVLADFETLITPAKSQDDDEDEETLPKPIYGWWRGRFPATDSAASLVEITLSPGLYGQGHFVIAGPDAATDQALIAAILEEINRFQCRCRRFSGGWADDPKMDAEIARVSWEDIVLAPALLTDIRRNIDLFFAQKAVFESLRLPWRRGILLVGPPGTGKTMVCKAAAAHYAHLPFLYVSEIGRHNSISEIEAIFHQARSVAPCILAFEDVDGLIDESNRSAFLNEMDGFRDNDGLLIIASSNHPERIDEALLKRPSRFDRVYHVGLPEAPERAEYCRRFLARMPNLSPELDQEQLCLRVAELTSGFTPAFLKEAFLSATLQMAQEGLMALDEMFGAAVLEQVDMLRRYLKKANNPEALADLVGANSAEIGFRTR